MKHIRKCDYCDEDIYYKKIGNTIYSPLMPFSIKTNKLHPFNCPKTYPYGRKKHNYFLRLLKESKE